jgi:hypothetical protein
LRRSPGPGFRGPATDRRQGSGYGYQRAHHHERQPDQATAEARTGLMTTTFVAVVRAPTPPIRVALLAAGAVAVLSWTELLTGPEPDDAAAVLIEFLADRDDADRDAVESTVVADLRAVLAALNAVDDAVEPDLGRGGAVIVTTRPVTDTLKLVDVAGTVIGTAERDDHRFVHTPIAARLRLFRSVATSGPDPVAVLTALAERGVTMIGT